MNMWTIGNGWELGYPSFRRSDGYQSFGLIMDNFAKQWMSLKVAILVPYISPKYRESFNIFRTLLRFLNHTAFAIFCSSMWLVNFELRSHLARKFVASSNSRLWAGIPGNPTILKFPRPWNPRYVLSPELS